jgi:hypothetical protein
MKPSFSVPSFFFSFTGSMCGLSSLFLQMLDDIALQSLGFRTRRGKGRRAREQAAVMI